MTDGYHVKPMLGRVTPMVVVLHPAAALSTRQSASKRAGSGKLSVTNGVTHGKPRLVALRVLLKVLVGSTLGRALSVWALPVALFLGAEGIRLAVSLGCGLALRALGVGPLGSGSTRFAPAGQPVNSVLVFAELAFIFVFLALGASFHGVNGAGPAQAGTVSRRSGAGPAWKLARGTKSSEPTERLDTYRLPRLEKQVNRE